MWKTPDPCVDDLQAAISAQIAQASYKDPTLLPDLRTDDDLVLAADYSGDHQSSQYQLLTFLLADRPGVLEHWDNGRREIRQRFLPEGRKHAFKKLSDSQRQKALGPFLHASSQINGVVFCVAIDKALANSSFGYAFLDIPAVKPMVLAKLVRVAFFGSLLVAGLSRSGQNLKWITDDDEIVSNKKMQDVACFVISSLFQRLCSHEFDDFSIGIAGAFDDGLLAEDLCSIPDLVGGSMSDVINAVPKNVIPKAGTFYTPIFQRQTTKATVLASWFAGLNGPLKKLFCLVRPDAHGGISILFGTPDVQIDAPYPRQIWLPPDRDWNRNWRPS